VRLPPDAAVLREFDPVDVRSVPGQVAFGSRRNGAKPEPGANPKRHEICAREVRAHQNHAAIPERDKSSIEQFVQIRRQQKAVIGVKSLFVSGALGPGHDVRSNQHCGRPASENAAGLPPAQERLSKLPLPNACELKSLALRFSYGPMISSTTSSGR
jgi:hypothetical protein